MVGVTSDFLLECECLRYCELESSLSLLFWQAPSDTIPRVGEGRFCLVIPRLPLAAGPLRTPSGQGLLVSAVQTGSSGPPCPLPAPRSEAASPVMPPWPSPLALWGAGPDLLGDRSPDLPLGLCDTSRAGSNYVVQPQLRERHAWAQRMAFAVEGQLGLQACPSVSRNWLHTFCLARLPLSWPSGYRKQVLGVFFLVCVLRWHFRVAGSFGTRHGVYEAKRKIQEVAACHSPGPELPARPVILSCPRDVSLTCDAAQAFSLRSVGLRGEVHLLHLPRSRSLHLTALHVSHLRSVRCPS